MELVRFADSSGQGVAGVMHERGVVLGSALGLPASADPLQVLSAISAGELRERMERARDAGFSEPPATRLLAPYLRPRKIWGIGINYVEHAADLGVVAPEGEPASFMKGDHTIIGAGDQIPLPTQSSRVTAEAELGLIIGRRCRNVDADDALSYVWGVCAVLDQTAEDILLRNPRYLTRAKNFPGFFSFGPGITPVDEFIQRNGGRLENVVVSTVLNGETVRSNTVANMIFPPEYLVAFHSRLMPLYPGDILSTGTPGAVVLAAGDVVTARVSGLTELTNTAVTGDSRPLGSTEPGHDERS
jgi:2-keto-4-pentenoate hydratase/2-oxohepta-3-ene-1,7-dioic acid hydratase in catechol pathway